MGIDILVPVLSRPQNVPLFMEAVANTQEPYRVVFICSPGDKEQIKACQNASDTLIVDWKPGRGDYAKKINYGFTQTENEWVFQGADDIRFSPLWDHHALMLARKRGKQVIGTNDLHNPAVKRRLQSTHTLFARNYITKHGGTLDSTGIVFCELYDHQYIDTEFVEVARRRKVWAFSRESIVEHFHPHWGLAPFDDTYTKAYRDTPADYALYMSRMGLATRNGRSERYRERQEARRAALLERGTRR